MGSSNPEIGSQQELDDSGYVQDDAPKKNAMCLTNLLDLSDDVLLYILRYCSPQDLKALGYTCSRLGSLILDRTLWQRVDARGEPSGKLRVKWLLTHALSPHTTALLLSGYAREAVGCLGYMNDPNTTFEGEDNQPEEGVTTQNVVRIPAHVLPRYGGSYGRSPYWPDQATPVVPECSTDKTKCPGPQPTMTLPALARLSTLCPDLTELALEYCVIDCVHNIRISMFPPSLRKLSLRGTKCYNLEKTFLFRIQDTLTALEELDVSCCDWVEPACLLALSKMEKLTKLTMQECPKLSEFVAYASLATRYGFKTLKILDLRGSPVGDSEVSALGWVPNLEELYLSPAVSSRHATHAHTHKQPTGFTELYSWEEKEPEYFASRSRDLWWVQNIDKFNQDHRNAFACTRPCGIPLDPLLIRHIPNMLAPLDLILNRDHRLNQNPVIPPDPYNPADNYIVPPPMPVAPRHVAPNVEDDENYEDNPDGSNDGDSKRKSLHTDAGPSKRQRMGEPCATKASLKYFDDEDDKKNTSSRKDTENDDDDDDDHDKGAGKVSEGPMKINEGASTSKSTIEAPIDVATSSTKTCYFPPVESKREKENVSVYVQFRRHQEAQNNNDRDEPNLNSDDMTETGTNESNPSESVIDESRMTPNSNGGESNMNTDEFNSTKAEANSSVDDVYSSDDSSQAPSSHSNYSYVQNKSTNTEPEEQESVRRVFYVNVARGRPSMYQISVPIQETFDFQPPPDINVIYSMWPRLEFASLVTDSAIRRFGRAEGDVIRYVHIGDPLPGPLPAMVMPSDPRARPDRSNLRILSVTGFQNITDVSLRHLATAAPRLEFLDFTGTAVTELGVEHFRNLQPNCEVRYGPNPPKDSKSQPKN